MDRWIGSSQNYISNYFQTHHHVMQHLHKSACLCPEGERLQTEVYAGAVLTWLNIASSFSSSVSSSPLLHLPVGRASIILSTPLLRKREINKDLKVQEPHRDSHNERQRKRAGRQGSGRERDQSSNPKGTCLSEMGFCDMMLWLFWLLFMWMFSCFSATSTLWTGGNHTSATRQKNR